MAILLGTQSNGETLPVQVNEFGQLVAKGIDGLQGEPGEKGEQGDPGLQGDPGPAGAGVPQPYGAEGTYLRIQSGVPAWLEGPPMPLDPAVFLTDNIDPTRGEYRRYIDDTGSSDSPKSGYDEWIKGQSYFDSPGAFGQGLGVANNISDDWYEFNIQGAAGKILQVSISYFMSFSASGATVEIELKSGDPALVGIKSTFNDRESSGTVKMKLDFTYLVSSDEINNARLTFKSRTNYGGDLENYALLQSYQLIDPAAYAILELKELRAAMAAKRD